MTGDLHPTHPFENIQGSRHIFSHFQTIQIAVGPSIYSSQQGLLWLIMAWLQQERQLQRMGIFRHTSSSLGSQILYLCGLHWVDRFNWADEDMVKEAESLPSLLLFSEDVTVIHICH